MQYTQQAAAVTAEVNKAVQGKQQAVNTIWMAMLAGGHVPVSYTHLTLPTIYPV